MKTNTFKKLAIAICALAVSGSAFAIPITGNIEFTGSVSLDGPVATATKVNSFFWGPNPNKMFVNFASGSFATEGVGFGSIATFASGWVFSPSTPTIPLWSVGGFTFDLLSSTIIEQSSTFLSISGLGKVSGNGYDVTNMEWAFTLSNAGGKTQVQYTVAPSAIATGVPDGGATVALLGASLLLVVVARQRISRRKA